MTDEQEQAILITTMDALTQEDIDRFMIDLGQRMGIIDPAYDYEQYQREMHGDPAEDS